MLPSFCNETVTVLKPRMVERRGTVIADWTNPTEAELGGCSVQPTETARDYDGRTLNIELGCELYAPPSADLSAGDRIVHDGRTFEIDGAPMRHKSPTGRVSHTVARLREWVG